MKAFKPRSHPSAFNSIEWIHDSYVRVVGEALELHSFNSIEWILDPFFDDREWVVNSFNSIEWILPLKGVTPRDESGSFQFHLMDSDSTAAAIAAGRLSFQFH